MSSTKESKPITLKNRADFMAMNKKAAKRAAAGLVLQVMPNDSGVMRVGYTVTKKTEKTAVGRNRIKRRLRAVAGQVLPLHAAPSCDYVLIGREASLDRPFRALCGDLKYCLEKLRYAKAPDDINNRADKVL